MKQIFDIRYQILEHKYLSSKLKYHPLLRSGFTLVELLLYMGLFIILLGVFIQLFGSLVSTQLESQATSSVSQTAKYVLARMNYDISRSQNILSPAQGATASQLQFIVNGQQYTYSLSGNNLTLTNSNGTNQLNMTETTISNLSFTPIGSSSGKYTIKVGFTVTSMTTNHTNTESVSMATTLGNR